MKTTTFQLDFPLPRQHLGLPLANGRLGVLLWGQARELCLTVALAGCWDRRYGERLLREAPYEELIKAWTPESSEGIDRFFWQNDFPFQKNPALPRWRGTRVGGGTFRLRLAGTLRSLSLDHPRGIVVLRTDAGTLEAEIDLASDQLSIRDPARLIEAVTPAPMWERLGESLAAVGFAPPERFPGGWFQPCPADPGSYFRMEAVAEGYRLTAALQNDASPPALPEPDFARARAWWKDYWDGVPEINFPDEKFNRFFRLALHKFAGATMPGGVPATLQGPWQEDYQLPRWSNDYHFNVNIQQIYGLAFAAGRSAHLLPLFDMLDAPAARRTLRENFRAVFGDRDGDGLLLSHAVDDRLMQVGGCFAGAFLDFVCGGWVALLYFEYYRHTGDRDFLRRRAMPFMRGAMRAFAAALREDDGGRLMIPVAVSAEYGSTFPILVNGRPCRQSTGKNPSNALTCCHALAKALCAGAAELGESPEPVWLDIQKRLPRFAEINNHVAIWEGQDLDVCHRHHSHLSMIHPFDLSAEWSGEEARRIDAAVEHWIGRGMGQWSEWCYPWAIMIQARWGMSEAPAALLEQWSRLFWNESLATVYLPRFRGISSHRRDETRKPLATNEVMQLDGTMAGATAMLEMLAHERGGVIECFAGVPAAWPVSFRDIRLPGRIVLSGEREGGRIRLRLRSPCAQSVRLRLSPGREIVWLELRPNREMELTDEQFSRSDDAVFEGSALPGIPCGAEALCESGG